MNFMYDKTTVFKEVHLEEDEDGIMKMGFYVKKFHMNFKLSKTQTK